MYGSVRIERGELFKEVNYDDSKFILDFGNSKTWSFERVSCASCLIPLSFSSWIACSGPF
jgi:hypothetical protein